MSLWLVGQPPSDPAARRIKKRRSPTRSNRQPRQYDRFGAPDGIADPMRAKSSGLHATTKPIRRTTAHERASLRPLAQSWSNSRSKSAHNFGVVNNRSAAIDPPRVQFVADESQPRLAIPALGH
jgi:hypothetical protein